MCQNDIDDHTAALAARLDADPVAQAEHTAIADALIALATTEHTSSA